MTSEVLSMLSAGFVSVLILFFALWLVHLYFKNAGIVDVGWGLGFIVLCVVYILHTDGFTPRNALCLMMVTLWGLRITLFLLKRLLHDKHEDKRYQKLRRDWGGHLPLKFFFFFEFQAVLQMIISIAFVVVTMNHQPGLSFFEIIGFIIVILALAGETISDEQLHYFKADPANKGKTCDKGLWYYSRHPNYFFEWVVWIGFFVYALGSPYGWLAVISPIVMLYLILYVSGIPMAEEQALKSRGDEYRKYQKTTSMLIPWFKGRAA